MAPSWEGFARTLVVVGGEPLGPVAATSVADELAALCARPNGGRILAAPELLPRLGPGPWRAIDPEAPPASFADVELAILPGSIGVVENAAVAVEGRRAPARSALFLCERLVLWLPIAAIVADMHEAVRRMSADATRFHHFTWVSGPSKTADIEQTLVLGAQGPRSLSVIGVDDG